MRYPLPHELRLAVNGLYDKFSRYKRPAHMDGDGVTPDEVARICRTGSLSQLTVEDLERYAFKAMTTWGGRDEFKHFLPRVFEIAAAEGQVGSTDLEVVFGKLVYGGDLPQGNWLSWRKQERAAVDTYLQAAWSHAVRTFPPPGHEWETIDGWLRALSQPLTDLGPLLAVWAEALDRGDLPAVRNLVALADRRWAGILSNPGPGYWWPMSPDSAQRVTGWLCLPERAAGVERAFFAQPPGLVADELSAGVRNLEVLRDYALR